MHAHSYSNLFQYFETNLESIRNRFCTVAGLDADCVVIVTLSNRTIVKCFVETNWDHRCSNFRTISVGFDQQYSSSEDFCPFPLQALRRKKDACFSFLRYKRNENDAWQLSRLGSSDDPQLGTEKMNPSRLWSFPPSGGSQPIRRFGRSGPPVRTKLKHPAGKYITWQQTRAAPSTPHFPPFRNHQFVKKRFIFKPEPFPKFPPRWNAQLGLLQYRKVFMRSRHTEGRYLFFFLFSPHSHPILLQNVLLLCCLWGGR